MSINGHYYAQERPKTALKRSKTFKSKMQTNDRDAIERSLNKMDAKERFRTIRNARITAFERMTAWSRDGDDMVTVTELKRYLQNFHQVIDKNSKSFLKITITDL